MRITGLQVQARLRFLLCTLFLFGLSALAYTPAFAKEKITWTVNDFIPFFIKEGSYINQGISDQLTLFFQKHLPEFDHAQEYMNFPRFFARADRGDLVCNPLLLKTPERELKLHFSKAFKPSYTHVLVSKKPIAHPKEGLDLAAFLAQQSKPLIIQRKRSYGPGIDLVLRSPQATKFVQETRVSTKQLFVMLEKGRIDYFLDIEASAVYLQRTAQAAGPFYNTPLAQDRLDRFGYAVCSNTPNGQKVIQKINSVLNQHQASKEFRDILEFWVAESNRARFRAFYDREILKR